MCGSSSDQNPSPFLALDFKMLQKTKIEDTPSCWGLLVVGYIT
jgi:hypothetical protein